MCFLTLDLKNEEEDLDLKTITATKLLQTFKEIKDVHRLMGQHDLLIETRLTGANLVELMKKIKTKFDNVGCISPLFTV